MIIPFAAIIDYAIVIVAFLSGLSVHEYAHARIALLFGDPTAREEGRVTINPLRHIDPLGFALIFIAGFGWAKPVPFNEYYFKNKVLGTLCVAAAGPLTNLSLVMLALLGLKGLIMIGLGFGFIAKFLVTLARINLMLGFFNLLPLPPLDGAHLYRLFGREVYEKLMIQLNGISFIIVLVLMSYQPLTEMWSQLINSTFRTLYVAIVGA